MNDTNWGAEAWREPALDKGATRIYSEHGRVLDNTDYRSHWLALDKGEFGGYYLTVEHGAGRESFQIAYSKRMVSSLALLDSDARYFLLHSMLGIHHKAQRAQELETSTKYRKAFAEGRLKKRSLPKRGIVKVWIEYAAPLSPARLAA